MNMVIGLGLTLAVSIINIKIIDAPQNLISGFLLTIAIFAGMLLNSKSVRKGNEES